MIPPDIIEVTLKVVQVLERLGITYHVGGSLASSSYGVARSTLDVDMVADIKPEQAKNIYKLLKEEFYVDTEMIQDAIRRRSSFNLIHLESMFKVDVFILKDRPFDREGFSRRIQKAVSSEDPEKRLFFASPEDTVLNKLEWYMKGGEVSDRQWNDVLGILKVQGKELDIDYLKRWAENLSLSHLLNKVFDEAEIS
jgi:hypothetical protein